MDCFYNDSCPNIPFKTFKIKVPLNSEVESASVEIDKTTEILNISLKKDDSIPNDFMISVQEGIVQKERYAFITIALIRRRSNTLERIDEGSFKITCRNSNKSTNLETPKTNSVLAEGRWIKVKISESGIYTISYNNLVDWGFSNPENVRVYGTGGKILSTRVNSLDPVDLYENPIYVETNGDGIFNAGDYILFYGQGVERIFHVSNNNRYYHLRHPYSDDAYYFITTKPGLGKRMETVDFLSNTPTNYTTSADYVAIYENEVQNPIKSGRLLFDELLTANESRNITFSVPVSLAEEQNASIQTQVIGFQSNLEPQCSFQFSINGETAHRTFLIGSSPQAISDVWDLKSGYSEFTPQSNTININAQFLATSVTARGAIDFIRLTARINLALPNTNRLSFWETKNMGTNKIKEFRMSGNNIMVFDVSDPMNPKRIATRNENNYTVWRYDMSETRNFFAMTATGGLSILSTESVDNQNIMSETVPNLIIVTAPAFRQQAEKLAEFRRRNNLLRVLVLEPQQIYNEFSSGIPDISAIRNMCRQFYLRSGSEQETLKYLLLIGDGSYHNKWAAKQTNYLLTYQAVNSQDKVSSFVSDDFFGLLDEGEGGQDLYSSLDFNGYLDIGVGRLPVETVSEARTVIDKIIYYNENPTLDPWKTRLTFLGDDADHLGDFGLQQDSYALSQIIRNKYPWFTNNLIFMDSYEQLSTPAGQRYPKVREAIDASIHKGTLFFNYTGHGSENQMAHEMVVDKNMVNSWINKRYLPFVMTASCEIAPYDNPSKKSLGEIMLLNPEGGAISLFTTTRAVTAYGNQQLSIHFYNRVFERNATGNYSTLGEILVDTKNMTSGGTGNHRKFSLLGDPSMKLLMPVFRVRTDSINGKLVSAISDTISALSKVRISGCITDTLGIPVNNFNGFIYPTVYDKFRTRQTLNNDGSGVFTYETQENILFRGKTHVLNGKFSFEFFVPKDINYNYGAGKISYYAQNGTIDAQGAYQNIVIGGSNLNQFTDQSGPEIKIFLNDTSFVSGSTVHESPLLIISLWDEHGINTTGIGIGHDITAWLKHNPNNLIILNNHYEAKTDSYQEGKVQYQLLNLPDGPNRITVRAWDILNNYSEKTIDFVVVNSQNVAIKHLLNYPNPFTTKTKFIFEHNQPHQNLDITVKIYTVSGRLIKTLHTNILGSLYQFNPLEWDGHDEFNDKIGRGVYIYSLTIKTPSGETATKFEKLVILK